MTLAIVLGFAVLAALSATALLWSHWPAWPRALLVVGVSAFYFYVDDAAHGLTGWPTADTLPSRFVLLAAMIDEPSADHPGGLYVWANPLADGKSASMPRAYRLPYSKDLHALLNEGMKKVRSGVSQVGTSEPKAGKGGFAWLRPGSDEQVVKLRDLPVPQLPEK
ncbi:MAG: hypothetical protein JSR59_07295 [Proteobacteria bacterium]|nr:hypothetical protein [Pseudomonadota bacterium]